MSKAKPTPPNGAPRTTPAAPPADDVVTCAERDSGWRRITRDWNPQTMEEAKVMAQECLWRAEALTSVLTDYVWNAHPISRNELQLTLEQIGDLLAMVSPLLDEWWHDEKELREQGWTPPTPQEGS